MIEFFKSQNLSVEEKKKLIDLLAKTSADIGGLLDEIDYFYERLEKDEDEIRKIADKLFDDEPLCK